MRISRLFVPQPLVIGCPAPVGKALARYVQRVLRLRNGDEVVVFDGSGAEYAARLCTDPGGALSVEPYAKTDPQSESPLRITLTLAMVRSERMDFAIQKAVELGVSAIEPIETEHCVVRLDANRDPKRLARRRSHWEGIIQSACEQSGRVIPPRLCEPCAFPAWLRDRTEADAELIFSPSAEQPLTPGRSATSVRILIGPEGGFSESEVAAATDAGFEPMRLGPRILRAETAATMAVGAVQLLWGDLSQHRQTDH